MVNFPFGIDINYNPGNAITGLTQLNNLLIQGGTAVTNFSNSFAGAGGGFGNFESSVNRTTTSVGRMVQVFNSSGQQIANSARLLTPFNAALVQTGNIAQQTATKFSAGLAPAISTVGGPLNSLNSQLAGTSGALNNIGTSGGNAATGLGRLRELFTGNRGLVFGASALFGTLTGIAFELQLVGDANNQVAQSQSVLNGLIAAGQQGSTQYSQAQQALAKDQRFLEFSTRNLALAFTNLIPDVLLLTNGLLNLTAKFATTGTAATTLGTGLTGLQTATTTTGTAMTTLSGEMTATSTTMGILNTSQTALTTETTVMRDLYAGIPPVMTAVRTEETALVTTTEALGASEAVLATETAVARDVVGTVPAVMAATRAEEGLLAGENAILGDSFIAMGLKADEGAAAAAAAGTKIGGLRGLITGALGAGGGAAIPIIGAIGFIAFAAEFAKAATDVVNSRLLAEKAIEDSNKKNSEGIASLQSDIQAGTANMTTYWNAYADQVNNVAAKVKASQAQMTTGMATGKPTTTTPTKPLTSGDAGFWEQQGQQDWTGTGKPSTLAGVIDTGRGLTSGGPIGNAFPTFTVEGQTLPDTPEGRAAAQKMANDRMIQRFGNIASATRTSGAGTLPTLSEVLAQQDARQAAAAKAASAAGQVDLGQAGIFKIGKEGISTEDLASLKEDQAAIEGILAAKPEGVDLTKDQLKVLGESVKDITKITGGATDATKSAEVIEKERITALKGLATAQNGYNAFIDKQPKILQDTGYYTKILTDEEQARQNGIRASAEVFIGQANAQRVSLGVATQVAAIGSEITNGIIEQRDSIIAANLVWGNMGTIVKGTSQTMGEWILSQQQASIAAVDVTQSLTNQTKAQYMANVGTLAGKQAARDFLDETIIGVAQNQQYVASLTDIATTMGITIPSGVKVTAAQLELAIQTMKDTGSAAAATGTIIQSAFEPAIKTFGSLIEAGVQGGKEFSKAWKGLDLSLPKGLSNSVKDFTKDMVDSQKQINTLTNNINVVLGAITSGFKLTESQAKSFGSSISSQLTEITKGIPALGQVFQPIQTFLGNLGKGEMVAGVTKVMGLWQQLQKIFADGIQIGDVETAMKLVNDILGEQIKVVEKADGAWKKFFSTQKEVAAGADQFKKGIQGLLDFEKKFGEIEDKAIKKGKPIPDLPGTVIGSTGTGRPVAPQAEPPGGGEPGIVSRFTKIQDATKGAGTTPVPDAKAVQTATAAINAALASTQTAFANLSNQGTNSMALLIGHMKAHITTIGTYFGKTIPTDLALSQTAFANFSIQGSNSVALLIGKLKAHITTITTYFAKTIPTDLALSQTAFANFAIQGSNSIALLITRLKAHVTTITTYFVKTIPSDLLTAQTAFTTFSVDASNAMSTLISSLKAHVTTIGTYFTKTIPTDLQTAADAFKQFMVDSSNAMATLIANIRPHIITIGTYFTKTIPDDMATATDAVDAFASDFTSVMGDVVSAASAAMKAVDGLAKAVDNLDGKTANVTVTTTFKTSGSPPSGGTKAGSSAQGLLANVISASSPKSFAEGGIQTIQGPQLTLFGDNPGGIETHAFIPHDNPFPILRKLAKMFSKNSRAGEIVDTALGRAEDMWIDLHLQIDNIMDGEKVSRQILRKTFKRMRTRP